MDKYYISSKRLLCAGYIEGAHGVRGQIKLRSLLERPEELAKYHVTDESGAGGFELSLERQIAEGRYIASVKGLNTREDAQKLRGQKLYIAREALPPTAEREYYDADLVGLRAEDFEGKNYGSVLAVHDFGGGPMLEIGDSLKTSFMLPFSDSCVPEVKVEERCVKIVLPEGWLDKKAR